ncbi:MAG: hypothetical protein J6Y09_03135, partial [Lachnospiraceae bacterium]|nr:hypothetical protein [Lachnospiraceae bacterium]
NTEKSIGLRTGEEEVENMKRESLFAACLAVIVLATSCGANTEVSKENNKIVLSEEKLPIESDGNKEATDTSNTIIAKNDKKVSMPIELGSKAKKCFAAGGTSGYLVLSDDDMNYYFQYIDSEAETIDTFEAPACTDKIILNMAVDKDNNLSLFLINGKRTENAGASIVKIDKNGTLLSEDDISSFFEGKQYGRTDMAIDTSGKCCFTFDNLIIGVNGQNCEEADCTEDDGKLELIDFGSGRTVRVVSNSNHEEEILVDDESGNFIKEKLPEFNATYYDVKAQEDGIYLFNQEGGIIKYSYEDGSNETVVSKDSLKFAGQDVKGSGFLEDGRLMVLIISDTESKIEIIPYME